ncbi:MAG TPA: MFS transporter [Arachnia sp.]|nr:MFS transporter [Arachnia sp.]
MAPDPSAPDPAEPESPPAGEPAPPREQGRWATSGVVSVGAASMFSDLGHEMVTSLLPAFVTGTLGAGPAALGSIEGVADALTGLSKLAGGPLASDPARRGRLASGGYLGTAAATAAIGLAGAIWQVAVLRATAWISRGIRSPARDMILTDLTRQSAYGRAFGFERAGDNLGAIVGPLLAAALVGLIGIRPTIWLSVIPSALAAVAITIASRKARATLAAESARRTLSLNLGDLRRAGLPRILTPVACFELGNLATTLLILRATQALTDDGWSLTAASSAAILMYAVHNAAASGSALLAGRITDRRGPRTSFTIGAVTYVIAYLSFASSELPAVLAVGFVLAGIGIGFAETAESTAVATTLPTRLRANAFGVLGLTQAIGDLGATVVAGLLWAAFGPFVAFGYAAIWMLASLATTSGLRPSATSAG